VVWIGGSTGSGKSTVTRLLAARHGLRVFPIDAFWYSHVARLGESEPGPDEQWLGRSPDAQAADFEALTRRRWPLVLADLAALPSSPPVIVEGPQVLPDLVPPGDRALFLVGTAAWQRAILEQRPLPATVDPDTIRRWLDTPHVPPGWPAAYAFVCECGRPACTATVRHALADFDASTRVIADGHY
jgi:hypothetical protein